MKYTITDMAKQFNLPASTIRYYEKIGLLENVEHIPCLFVCSKQMTCQRNGKSHFA